MKRIPSPAVLLLGLATLGTSSPVGAVPCFPNAIGVPGNIGEAPRWWADPAPVGENPRWIEDPRWQGASSFGEQQDSVRFRGLKTNESGTDYFVLMWYVRADASGSTTDDKLYFGFYDDTMKRGVAAVIESNGLTPGEYAPSASAFYTAADTDGDADVDPVWTSQSVPSWLTDAKIDVFSNNEWAVRVRVPLTTSAASTTDAPLTAGGSYKFFHQVQSDANVSVSPYAVPDSLTDYITDGASCLTTVCVPSPATWEAFQNSGSCTGDVSIRHNDVYVNTSGNTTISLSGDNDIHAHPANNTTSALNGDSIRAKFRLANWGSVIGDSPTWQLLSCPGADAEGYVAGAAGTIPGVTMTTTSHFSIVCDNWPVPPGDVPLYDPSCVGATCRNPDQCVLVDLAMATGATTAYTFAPQSTWQNLQFTGASKMVKKALIDVRGLEASDPPRDVYLYVKTTNLPGKVTADTPTPAGLAGQTLLGKLAQGKVPPLEGRSVGAKQVVAMQQAMDANIVTMDEVLTFMPSYTVYAWHDTGKKHKGKVVLKPQPSFTYVVHHDGPLEGWLHSLTAPGFTLTELAPNYYKLAVPTGGQATVVTTIESLEKPLCPDGTPEPCLCPNGKPKPCPKLCADGSPMPCHQHHGHPWWVWALIALGVVIVIVLLVRVLKKKP